MYFKVLLCIICGVGLSVFIGYLMGYPWLDCMEWWLSWYPVWPFLIAGLIIFE